MTGNDGSYPLLEQAMADGRVTGEGLPTERRLRCGPWVDGRCEKCGRLDPLDFMEEDDDQ
jgi:hypothetical protein